MRRLRHTLTAAAFALLLVGCDREALRPPTAEGEGAPVIEAEAFEEGATLEVRAVPIADPEAEPEPERVDVPEPVAAIPTPPTASEPARTYTVQRGETLSNIASEQLGDGNRWLELYEANRDVIGDDPDGIRSGMVLTLP